MKVEPTMETDELDMLKTQQHRQGVMTKDVAVQLEAERKGIILQLEEYKLSGKL